MCLFFRFKWDPDRIFTWFCSNVWRVFSPGQNNIERFFFFVIPSSNGKKSNKQTTVCNINNNFFLWFFHFWHFPLSFGLSTRLTEVWASMSFIWFIWQQLFSLSRLKKNHCVFNFVLLFFLKCDAQFGPFFFDTGSRSGIIANLWVLL